MYHTLLKQAIVALCRLCIQPLVRLLQFIRDSAQQTCRIDADMTSCTSADNHGVNMKASIYCFFFFLLSILHSSRSNEWKILFLLYCTVNGIFKVTFMLRNNIVWQLVDTAFHRLVNLCSSLLLRDSQKKMPKCPSCQSTELLLKCSSSSSLLVKCTFPVFAFSVLTFLRLGAAISFQLTLFFSEFKHLICFLCFIKYGFMILCSVFYTASQFGGNRRAYVEKGYYIITILTAGSGVW